MFCPNCSLENKEDHQFCRSCGADLNTIRMALSSPEGLSDSALARTEIGRAFAKKIEGVTSGKELRKVAKEVLPEIEKFLESPAEKRLRRIRTGSLISLIGLGVAIGFFVAALFADKDLFVLSSLGFVTFFIGMAFLINGFFFSLPRELEAREAEPSEMPKSLGGNRITKDLLMPPSARSEFSSVTEHTTRTLKEKLPVKED